MPRAKKTTTKEKSAKKSVKTTDSKVTASTVSPLNRLKGFKAGRREAVVLIIVILLILAYFNKGSLIAAMVNGQPITSLELNQRMSKLYREKTLTQMINEKILEQEARKNGISVTPQEVQDKITQTEAQYGGKDTLDSLLAQQDLSRDEFTRQTQLQLLVEKMYEKDATPSADEIEKFLTDNKEDPQATEPAKFRATAIDSLKQQKLSQLFSQKFQELKTSAKIQTF